MTVGEATGSELRFEEGIALGEETESCTVNIASLRSDARIAPVVL